MPNGRPSLFLWFPLRFAPFRSFSRSRAGTENKWCSSFLEGSSEIYRLYWIRTHLKLSPRGAPYISFSSIILLSLLLESVFLYSRRCRSYLLSSLSRTLQLLAPTNQSTAFFPPEHSIGSGRHDRQQEMRNLPFSFLTFVEASTHCFWIKVRTSIVSAPTRINEGFPRHSQPGRPLHILDLTHVCFNKDFLSPRSPIYSNLALKLASLRSVHAFPYVGL